MRLSLGDRDTSEPDISHETQTPLMKHSPIRSTKMLWQLLMIGLAVCLTPSVAHAQRPWEVRLDLNNDYLTNNTIDDDFYTFGLRFEVSYGKTAVRFEENAFTDRVDGMRFDETYLTFGRLLPESWLGEWFLWLEAGVAHIGEGLLGENAQNTVHDLFDIEQVNLTYLPDTDDYHVHVQGQLGRQWQLGEHWSFGPQIGFGATPDFRWNAVAGLRTIWRPTRSIALDVTVGGRFADTELPLLEPHIENESLAALVDFRMPLGFVIEYSLNRYGTDREHISFGYRIGTGESPRRQGAGIVARVTP